MTSERDYRKLQAELQAIEKRTGLYLADESVDLENVSSPNDWAALCRVARNAAGERAEEAGFDINVLIGRTIY